MVGTRIGVHGQVAKGVVELLVVHPQERGNLGIVLPDPLHKVHGLDAFLLCLDAELHQQHNLAAIAQSEHDAAHKSRMLSGIVEGKSLLVAIVAYAVAYAVVQGCHQVALLYGQNLVKGTAGMESHGAGGILGNLGNVGCQSLGMLVGKHLPYLVGKTELHLVAVFFRLCRTKDGRAFGQVYLAYTGQIVHHLTLLPVNLLVIAKALPFATAAHTIMRTYGLMPVLAHLVETEHGALHEMVLLACNPNVHHIAWNGVWHKENHIVYTGQ